MFYQEVTAPQARAQTSANLLASALVPASPDDRWMNGLSFLGEACPLWRVFGPCDELDTVPDGDTSEPSYVQPLAYQVSSECSTLAVDQTSQRERLIRLAEAVASFAVARELWTGAGAQANPFPEAAPNGALRNGYLMDSNAEIISDTPVSDADALGLLEQEARERTGGQQVFLHIPLRMATRLAQHLVRVGNELRTPTDAIVIADAGYTGVGPGASPTGIWGFATGPVAVRLGPVASVDDLAAVTDRRTNRVRYYADRMFAVAFDSCAQLAIQFPAA